MNAAGKAIALTAQVLEGPAQPDGSDPTDRTFDCFVTLDFSNVQDASFKDRLANKLATMLKVHGLEVDKDGTFDPEDGQGAEYSAVVETRKDQYGVDRNDIREFLV